MRNVMAVAGKELRAYFHSPIAYLVMTVWTALCGFIFYVLTGNLRISGCSVPPASLSGGRAVYDLVYEPVGTSLLAAARAAGCITIGGLEMLVAQAVDQFEWWTGLAAPREAMRAAAEDRSREMAGIA